MSSNSFFAFALRGLALTTVLVPAFLHAGPTHAAETVEPESVGMAAEPLAQLAADMRGIVDSGERAGIVSLVSRRGRLVHFQAYGMADLEAGRPMRADTLFRMCSMTRPLTVVAAMMLYEQGKFTLEQPISAHLPMFSRTTVLKRVDGIETEPARSPITVAHVMTHTSGYPYAGEYPKALGITQDEILEAPTLMEAMTRLSRYPTLLQPGARWYYGFSTDIVGALVEVASGQSYADFVAERVFEPLGMNASTFRPNGADDPRFATTYGPGDDGTLVVSERIGQLCFQMQSDEMVSPGGGLATTIGDYWRLAQMLLNGGGLDGKRLLKPETVDLMTRNHLREGQGPLFWYQAGRGEPGDLRAHFNGYGYGLQLGVRLKNGKHSRPGSPGEFLWGGLADTTFFIDPQEEIVAIAGAQFLGPPSAMARLLRQRIYESLGK